MGEEREFVLTRLICVEAKMLWTGQLYVDKGTERYNEVYNF